MNNHPTKFPADPLAAVRFWALIACAGVGARAGANGPKQYQALAGRPLVAHTLAAFSGVARVTKIVVVVAADDHFFNSKNSPYWIAYCGGVTRAATVSNGLNFLLENGADRRDWVLVHDGARCLITTAQIDALIDACAADEVGGLLAHQLPDTLKLEVGGRAVSTLDRRNKWLAQTPQMFRIGTLLDALAQVGQDVTDEAGAIEAMGLQPLLVPGSAQNFKVTYPEDFVLAEAVLTARLNALPKRLGGLDSQAATNGSNQSRKSGNN